MEGNYIGAAKCQAMHRTSQPPVPYGPDNANADTSLLAEEGFKRVRGDLTEGRYLVFETSGFALTNPGNGALRMSSTPVSEEHEDVRQRWIIHRVGEESGDWFVIQSAVDGRYVTYLQGLTSWRALAETYRISDLGDGKGYRLRPSGFLSLGVDGRGGVLQKMKGERFSVFSVTYHDGWRPGNN